MLWAHSLGAWAQTQEMALQGHNWGGVSIQNGSLVFTVGGKPLFEVPLKDVAQVGAQRGVGVAWAAVSQAQDNACRGVWVLRGGRSRWYGAEGGKAGPAQAGAAGWPGGGGAVARMPCRLGSIGHPPSPSLCP